MVAVVVWAVLYAPYGGLGGVAGPLGLAWPPWGVATPLGPVYLPWRHGRFPGALVAEWGRGGSFGRGQSPRPCTAAVRAWPLPWALYGRRGRVAGPLGPAWHVLWAPCGHHGGVGGPLATVWPSWKRGRRWGLTGPLDSV